MNNIVTFTKQQQKAIGMPFYKMEASKKDRIITFSTQGKSDVKVSFDEIKQAVRESSEEDNNGVMGMVSTKFIEISLQLAIRKLLK